MKEANSSNASMKYYNFFTKVYLVIVIFFNIIMTFGNLQYVQEWNILSVIIMAIDIIFYVILPIQLKDELTLKTKRGYRLVLIFLIFDFIYKIINSIIRVYLSRPNSNIGIDIIIFFLIYSIWYVPNLIYFVKRKEIFVNEKDNRTNKENSISHIELVNNKKEEVVEAKKTVEIIEEKEVNQNETDTRVKKKTLNDITCWKIVSISLIIFIVILIAVLIFTSTGLNKQINNLQDIISNLNEEKDKISEESSNNFKKYMQILSKASFFDNHAVIIPANTKVYHKYDCTYCDKSSFLIFNIESARGQGYKACSHCIK